MARTFQFKNLMVNIGASKAEEFGGGAAYCALGAGYSYPCGRFISPVIHAEVCRDTLQCGITPYCGYTPYKTCERTVIPDFENPYTPVVAQNTPVITDVNVLGVLKTDLNKALAEVERQEKILANAQTPQTLEEANMVEEELNMALQEVAAVKAKLKK